LKNYLLPFKVAGYRLDNWALISDMSRDFSLFTTTLRSALRSTQAHFQWILEAASQDKIAAA
jgi:hypothetical protein